MDQLQNQVAQQAVGSFTSELAKKEREQREAQEQAKRVVKQQGMKQVNKVVEPHKQALKDKLMSKIPAPIRNKMQAMHQGYLKVMNKVTSPLRNGLAKMYKTNSKILNKISKSFGKGKVGQFFAKSFSKMANVQAMAAERLQSVGKKAVAKVATKGVSAALSVPTAGASLAIGQAVDTAQTVGEATKAVSKTAKVTSIAKDVTKDVAKDAAKDKATQVVQNQINKTADKIIPQASSLQRLSASNQSKDEKGKDNNVAILSGTKDMMNKVGFKGFDLSK